MIEPTIDLESAASVTWDALVVGAGPAGALAARQMALTGKRVLLVDCKSFPRPKVCGACLNGAALAVLSSVGLGGLPESLGGIRLDRFHIRSAGQEARLALPHGMAVSRLRFDAALVHAAIEEGVDFLPETVATVGKIDRHERQEHREVSLRTRAAACVLARARVVLAADGLAHASLREHAEFTSQVPSDARVGLGGQVADFPSAYAPGTIFMAVGRNGYVGLVRVEDGSLNVAAALAPDFLRSAGGPPQAVGAVLDEAGFPSVAALSRADWHGTIALTRSNRHVAARRLLLLGDAAGYVEPFTGEGMAWALAAAAAAPSFVERGIYGWDAGLEREWRATLRRNVFGRRYWCRLLSSALRHPLPVRIALSALALAPKLAHPVIRRLNRPLPTKSLP